MAMESYYNTHEILRPVKRKRFKRAGEYDPDARKSDIRYTDDYGL